MARTRLALKATLLVCTALSATPALHGFGLMLLLGIGSVWLLSPCLRPTADPATPLAANH